MEWVKVLPGPGFNGKEINFVEPDKGVYACTWLPIAPFDASRMYGGITGLDPRIWTASPNLEMWAALQD
jgi:hypothetical protein